MTCQTCGAKIVRINNKAPSNLEHDGGTCVSVLLKERDELQREVKLLRDAISTDVKKVEF